MRILKKKGMEELSSKFKPAKYEEMRKLQRRTINFSVFYVGVFLSLLFNYFLKLYIGNMMATVFEFGIRTADRMGLEVHLIRLLYFTLFDVDLRDKNAYPPIFSDPAMAIDLAFLIFIIFPLFVCSLKYLTQPMTQGPFKAKSNALLAPLGVLPVIFFSDWDICFMSA